MNFEVLRLNGNEARAYVNELADLRLKVFWDYPYLYEGTHEYEVKYLETYFSAQNSFVLIVKDQGKVIGATTGIWAKEEEEALRKPFLIHGLDPAVIFYFGESVLLKEYRGKGIGKLFFEEREKFARSLVFIELLSFCAVIRDEAPPADYRPLDEFWKSQGFLPEAGLIAQYAWPDRGQTENTEKTMQYWLKKL